MDEDKIANAAYHVRKLTDILETMTYKEAEALRNRVASMNSTVNSVDAVIAGIVNALDSF